MFIIYIYKWFVVFNKYDFIFLNWIIVFNVNYGFLVNRFLKFELYFILKVSCCLYIYYKWVV